MSLHFLGCKSSECTRWLQYICLWWRFVWQNEVRSGENILLQLFVFLTISFSGQIVVELIVALVLHQFHYLHELWRDLLLHMSFYSRFFDTRELLSHWRPYHLIIGIDKSWIRARSFHWTLSVWSDAFSAKIRCITFFFGAWNWIWTLKLLAWPQCLREKLSYVLLLKASWWAYARIAAMVDNGFCGLGDTLEVSLLILFFVFSHHVGKFNIAMIGLLSCICKCVHLLDLLPEFEAFRILSVQINLYYAQ